MPKILVVEDDSYFREAICEFLKGKGYSVLQAPNGRIAKEVISVQNLDIVLSDIQMPMLSGTELLEWAMKNKPLPFIIMTGFSMLLETKSAFELGAKEFLAKPFKNEELIAAIERIIAPKKEFEIVSAHEQYCKVSIGEFVARPKVDFDVYVQLGSDKYIKIVRKGEEIQKERVEHYKEKGLKYLYIAKEDFGKLVDFNMNVAKLIKDRGDVSQEKKLNFMKYTGEVILERAFIDGVDKGSFLEAQTFLKLTINTIVDTKEQFDLLDMLNSHSDFIYAHSIGVAMFSILIGRKLGHESNLVFFKLSTAAMFHDIGKKEIDREILEKPRHLLSTKERKLIESHVVRGQEIMSAIKGMSEEITQIVYEHHEDSAGQGYPLCKRGRDLHPLSKIIQTANLFVEHALKGPTSEGMAGVDAIKYLERIYLDRLDTASMAALKSLFIKI